MKIKHQSNPFKLDEDEDAPSSVGFLPYAERTINLSEITYYIDEDVQAPRYYRHVVEKLQQLTSNDQVRCMINSGGGFLSGLTSLLEATANTDAATLAVLTGDCHSAASMLALAHDSITVSPYATMLVHFVSYGANGKGQDVLDRVMHSQRSSEALFKEIYWGFLTETELQEVIQGKQLWLVAGEIEERLAVRQALRDEQDKQDALEAEEGKKGSTEVIQEYLDSFPKLDTEELDALELSNPVPKKKAKNTKK